MRLILVRHGQTSSNVGGLLDTDEPGAELTPLGQEQAAALPGAFADEPIEAIYASTLVRTQQTAAPLAAARALPVQVRAGLCEVRAGDLEMLGDQTSVERYLTTVLGWANGDAGARMPGGECGTDVLARFDEVIAEAVAAGLETVVVVSHGAMLRCWTAARTDNVSVEHAALNPIANTGAIVVEGSPADGWHALTWEGHALGGPALDTPATDGPAGEPVRP